MHPFKFNPLSLLNLFLVIVVFTIPGSADEKCSACTQSSPPPPSPSPPPPSPPPPSPCPPPPSPPAQPPPEVLPPPTPKKPSTTYCPPPPASMIYITGPPGTLYPIDDHFNNGGSQNSATVLSVLVSCGLLGLLAFW